MIRNLRSHHNRIMSSSGSSKRSPAYHFTLLLACCVIVIQQSAFVVTAKQKVNNYIVGGVDAYEGEFPWMVRYINVNGELCGGSLVYNDIVITAASCVINGYPLEVTVGAIMLDSGGQTVQVCDVSSYPGYTKEKLQDDLAVMTLCEPINDIEPVELNTELFYPQVPGQIMTVLGFGATDEDNVETNSETLQKIELEFISDEECLEEVASLFTNSVVCGRAITEKKKGGGGICDGDDGGPLLDVNNLQVGLATSPLGGCKDNDEPNVFTEMGYYHNWIKEQVCEKSFNPPIDLCPNALFNTILAFSTGVFGFAAACPAYVLGLLL